MTIEYIREALLKGAEVALEEGLTHADEAVIPISDEPVYDMAEAYCEWDDLEAGETSCLFLLFVRAAISE